MLEVCLKQWIYCHGNEAITTSDEPTHIHHRKKFRNSHSVVFLKMQSCVKTSPQCKDTYKLYWFFLRKVQTKVTKINSKITTENYSPTISIL